MSNDQIQNHTTGTITKRDQRRFDEEREDWYRADRDRRCPGCDDNGYSVTMGRREPEATVCPICQGAPHPVDAPHAHLSTLDGERWHESNLRCDTCAGIGEVAGHFTGEPFEQSHAETCPDCGGLGVVIMPGDDLQVHTEHDTEALVGACEAAIRELEAVQVHDGYAPSTETVLQRLYRALGQSRPKNGHAKEPQARYRAWRPRHVEVEASFVPEAGPLEGAELIVAAKIELGAPERIRRDPLASYPGHASEITELEVLFQDGRPVPYEQWARYQDSVEEAAIQALQSL